MSKHKELQGWVPEPEARAPAADADDLRGEVTAALTGLRRQAKVRRLALALAERVRDLPEPERDRTPEEMADWRAREMLDLAHLAAGLIRQIEEADAG